MTAAELRTRFPHASAQFIARNSSDGKAPASKLEQSKPDAPSGADQPQARRAGKFLVRVKSFRRRLLDEDNLCEKYHVDCLRYAGIIPTDAPGLCRIETTQQKVGKKEEERVEIEVVPPSIIISPNCERL